MNNLENKYICKYCGRTFKRQCDLSLHINITHLKITKLSRKTKECLYCHKNISILSFNKHFNKCKNDHKLYYCEKCGKLVTEKFGSGKFCSRKCANSHKMSEDTKLKISNSVKKNPHGWASQNYERKREYKKRLQEYNKNPNKCKVCGKLLDYKHKHRKTCGDKNCLKVLNSKNGGYKKHSRKGNAGYYKGFYCDSTYELIFLIYCLDHNIKIERNKQYFLYKYENKIHKYYPDFLINNNTLIEIKNFDSELVRLKLASVNKPIKILFGKDLINMAKYVANKYNIKFNDESNKINGNFKDLYDK